MKRLSEQLAVADGEIVCRGCTQAICEAGENYKLHALCDRKPLADAGEKVNDPERYVDAEMEFRQFYCPGCGSLLGNEVSKADDAPTHDRELAE